MKDSIVDIPPALLVSCKSCIGSGEEDGVTTTGGLLSDSVPSPKNSNDGGAVIKNRRANNMSKLSRMSQTFSSFFATKPTGEYVISSSRCHSQRSDTRSHQS